MVCGIGLLYRNAPADQAFLHILLFLTIIGAYMNTSMFDPTRDKYYAMILLRMNAREYTLVNYGYNILKVIIGFLPFSILFGMMREREENTYEFTKEKKLQLYALIFSPPIKMEI